MRWPAATQTIHNTYTCMKLRLLKYIGAVHGLHGTALSHEQNKQDNPDHKDQEQCPTARCIQCTCPADTNEPQRPLVSLSPCVHDLRLCTMVTRCMEACTNIASVRMHVNAEMRGCRSRESAFRFLLPAAGWLLHNYPLIGSHVRLPLSC